MELTFLQLAEYVKIAFFFCLTVYGILEEMLNFTFYTNESLHSLKMLDQLVMLKKFIKRAW